MRVTTFSKFAAAAAAAIVLGATVILSPPAPSAAKTAAAHRAFPAGEKVFAANCTGCHGATGTGQPGIFPSLAANPYVAGDAKRVIHTVKYGLKGPITAKGVKYNGVMPPWDGTLTDQQIADAISYIRAAWGNNASRVTAAQVRAVAK